MDYLTPEKMKQYFELLKDVLEEHNVDETGMPLDHRPPKIVTLRGQKKVRCRTSGNKSQITVIGCISASGQAIHPLLFLIARDRTSSGLMERSMAQHTV